MKKQIAILSLSLLCAGTALAERIQTGATPVYGFGSSIGAACSAAEEKGDIKAAEIRCGKRTDCDSNECEMVSDTEYKCKVNVQGRYDLSGSSCEN